MIEIFTTSLFVFSSIYGGPMITSDANNLVLAKNSVPEASSKVEVQATTSIPTRKELEKLAKAYFKDDPILVDIARCESQFRQLDKDGNILRGEKNKGDLGLMQINEYYHADKAKELGFDLTTVEGNMAYAKYLYNKEGGQPWISSSKCWSKVASTTNQELAINQ